MLRHTTVAGPPRPCRAASRQVERNAQGMNSAAAAAFATPQSQNRQRHGSAARTETPTAGGKVANRGNKENSAPRRPLHQAARIMREGQKEG